VVVVFVFVIVAVLHCFPRNISKQFLNYSTHLNFEIFSKNCQVILISVLVKIN